jgi:hypothetical protein
MHFWYSAGANSNAGSGNVGVQSGGIYIWGVQLEVGTAATPLEKPDPQQDLAKCQRFYQTVTASLRAYAPGANAISACSVSWPPMRVMPTVGAPTGTTSGNANSIALLAEGNNAGYFTFTSAAVGDTYALGAIYPLSADL